MVVFLCDTYLNFLLFMFELSSVIWFWKNKTVEWNFWTLCGCVGRENMMSFVGWRMISPVGRNMMPPVGRRMMPPVDCDM